MGTGLEPPAAKGGRTAHPSHALGTYLGSAKLVNRDDGHPGEPRELPPDKGQRGGGRVATGREVEPGGAKKYHSLLAGLAELVANIM